MTHADDPTRRNRLGESASPYLQQHADNPVHWQPWDEAALRAARERDVPIFLSVGYSSCHWCHVMAEESFEDGTIAAKLNEGFVPIKVDREERPDVDSVYMTVSQFVTGHGGWPLSVWLTPEGKPFYVGTYYPPEPERGQPGFGQLLDRIAEAWRTDRDSLEERAEQWTAAAADELESVPDDGGVAPDEGLLEAAAEAAVRSADREHGGFGSAPKFPQPQRLDLLFRAHHRTGREPFCEVAGEALDAMAAGGIHDQLGGGFHRYATDRKWAVPHFEKMLYDNAELTRAYLSGYRVTGDSQYAEVARRTLAFVERELTHPDGAFFSTLDARSLPPGGDATAPSHRGEEGAFYVWTPEQVHEAVDDARRADLFCDRYGVTAGGNFEGATVLTAAISDDDLAREYDLSADEVKSELDRAREAAFAARETRPRPGRDEKVLAGWNGLMISAFADAALALDARYAEPANDALSFLRERLWDGERLFRRHRDAPGSHPDGPKDGETAATDGDVAVPGYLEDYAFLARGALDTYGVTGDVGHLAFAMDLARAIEAEFWDAERGTLYFTPASGEKLLARPQELTDNATPSSVGVAAHTLVALSHFVEHERFADVAEAVVETHARRVEQNPLAHASLAVAADALAVGHLELTVVADGLSEEWRTRLGTAYLPDRLLAPRPPSDAALDGWLDALDLAESPSIWAGRGTASGEPTVYVCRRACSPPLTDAGAALEWAADLSP